MTPAQFRKELNQFIKEKRRELEIEGRHELVEQLMEILTVEKNTDQLPLEKLHEARELIDNEIKRIELNASPQLSLQKYEQIFIEKMAGVLTKREIETLLLILKGYKAKEIARELGISPSTAKAHRANGFARLHLKSDAELYTLFIKG